MKNEKETKIWIIPLLLLPIIDKNIGYLNTKKRIKKEYSIDSALLFSNFFNTPILDKYKALTPKGNDSKR